MARKPIFFAWFLCTTFATAFEPKLEGSGATVDTLLRKLPTVASVEVLLNPVEAERSFIHIKDWHFVPREMFAADIRSTSVSPVTDAKIEQQFEEHLREVALVQDDQIKLLRKLIENHGVRRVFCEGLADNDMPIYRAKLRVLKQWQSEIPELQEQLQGLNESLQQLSNDTEEYRATLELREEFLRVVLKYRGELLRIGAVGRLVMANELEAVLPLEDLDAYQRANPLNANGQVELRQADIDAREDAQVKRLLKHRGVSVVILGGKHDLSDNISKLAPQGIRYITVTTNSYPNSGL